MKMAQTQAKGRNEYQDMKIRSNNESTSLSVYKVSGSLYKEN